MKIIIPIEITEEKFIDSNVPEDSRYPEHIISNAYLSEQRVLSSAAHSIFECIQDAPPDTPLPVLEDGWVNDYWYRIGASERWSVFDKRLGSTPLTKVVESGNTSVSYTIRAGVATGLALLGVSGLEVRITVNDPSLGLIYDEVIDLAGVGKIKNWYDYFSTKPRIVRDLALFNLPGFAPLSELTVEIIGGSITLAELVLGQTKTLGITQYAPEFSIIDFSRKETDAFGNFLIMQRAFSKRIDVRCVVMNQDIADITHTLTKLRTTPIVWVPTQNLDYESTMLVYGYYKDFKIVIPHPVWADMTLQIEGLT